MKSVFTIKGIVAAILLVSLAGCIVVPARPYGGYYYGHPCCYRH